MQIMVISSTSHGISKRAVAGLEVAIPPTSRAQVTPQHNTATHICVGAHARTHERCAARTLTPICCARCAHHARACAHARTAARARVRAAYCIYVLRLRVRCAVLVGRVNAWPYWYCSTAPADDEHAEHLAYLFAAAPTCCTEVHSCGH